MMAMHGPTSNEAYVRKIVHFARVEKRAANHVRHRDVWHVYDSRSGKLLTEPHESRAKAWKALADQIRANGGSLINHSGPSAIQSVRDNRDSSI